MRLNRLNTTDFMGIGSIDLVPNGHNVKIAGKNGAGKSSLMSGYTWLLFGKDSRGSATFEIRPLIDGEPMHEGEHGVEAEFDLGDTTIVLKRVLAERWSRPRGKAHKEFKGTETTYYVDGAPVKAAEYQAKVAELFGTEKGAQMMSDPLYFAGAMPWQERRTILLGLADDVFDHEVVASNEALAELPTLTDDIEHFRSVAKAKAGDLKRKLDQYPGQIREASRGANPAAPTVKAAQAEVDKLEAVAAEAAKVSEVAKAAERKAYEAMQEARIAFAQAQAEAKSKDTAARANLVAEENQIRRDMKALIAQGERIKDEGTCPECGQPLDKKHAKKERERLRKEYDALAERLAAVSGEIAEVGNNPVEADPSAYDKAKAVYEEAKAALAEVGVVIDTGPLEAARANLRAAEAAEATRTRVAALKDEERATAEAYEEAMHHLWLCEEFTRTKVGMVEASINDKFRLVKWRLFEPLNNGGIKEVADATMNGTPWANLSTGERMLAGLDIIDTIADSGTRVPIWLDNAESLTASLDIDSQLIELRADRDVPTLTITVDEPAKARKAA